MKPRRDHDRELARREPAREDLRILHFVERLRDRHPEFGRLPLVWDDFVRIVQREGIFLKVLPLSRPARMLRYGQYVAIQINRALDLTARTRFGMHELCHVWRDDIGEPCYYADDEWLPSPSEDFAETFAWYVTQPNPLPPLR